MQVDPVSLEEAAVGAVREHLLFDEGDRIEEIEPAADAVLVHTTRMSWRVVEVAVPSPPGLRLLAVSPDLMSDPPLRPTMFAVIQNDVLALEGSGQLLRLWRLLPDDQRGTGMAATVLALSNTSCRAATIVDLRVDEGAVPVLSFSIEAPRCPRTSWRVELSEEPVVSHLPHQAEDQGAEQL